MGATVPICNKQEECPYKDGGYCSKWKSECEFFTTVTEQ